MRAELADTKSTVAALSDRITLLTARNNAPASTVAAMSPNSPLATLPVVRLEKKREKAGSADNGAIDDGSPPILIKVGPNDTAEKLSVDHEVLAKPDPVLSAKGVRATEKREKADYDVALATLREQVKPDEARKLFVAFTARYPKSDLADNVAYWMSECSFAEGQWARAIDEMSKLMTDRPQSSKVPDALLRTAEAWLKLGKAREAEEVLRRLIKNYPNSAARPAADQRLTELGAT